MLKFNYFNADKTPFKQRLNESDERERKTSKNVLFVLENCTFRFADYNYCMSIDRVYFFGDVSR